MSKPYSTRPPVRSKPDDEAGPLTGVRHGLHASLSDLCEG